MKKTIHFTYEACDQVKPGNSIIGNDGSFMYLPYSHTCSFSIYPFHWSFEITTTDVSNNKYALEYCIGNYALQSFETAEISVPESIPGVVYAELNFPHADGVYYADYEVFLKKKYFDPVGNILAIGNIYGKGKCIEFACGQYIVIDDQNKLVAVYVVIN